VAETVRIFNQLFVRVAGYALRLMATSPSMRLF